MVQSLILQQTVTQLTKLWLTVVSYSFTHPHFTSNPFQFFLQSYIFSTNPTFIVFFSVPLKYFWSILVFILIKRCLEFQVTCGHGVWWGNVASRIMHEHLEVEPTGRAPKRGQSTRCLTGARTPNMPSTVWVAELPTHRCTWNMSV